MHPQSGDGGICENVLTISTSDKHYSLDGTARAFIPSTTRVGSVDTRELAVMWELGRRSFG